MESQIFFKSIDQKIPVEHLLHDDEQKDEGRSYEHKLVCPSSILLFNIREIAKSRLN